MPLNSKGSKIMSSMKSQYGDKRGEQIFYASRNKGTIKGVEGKRKHAKTQKYDASVVHQAKRMMGTP